MLFGKLATNLQGTQTHVFPPQHFSVSLLLTHGLVSGGYRSGMMQYQDLSLKLPSGLWAQPWGNHHHAFPYGRALDLYKEPERGGLDDRGHRQRNKEVFIFFNTVNERWMGNKRNNHMWPCWWYRTFPQQQHKYCTRFEQPVISS